MTESGRYIARARSQPLNLLPSDDVSPPIRWETDMRRPHHDEEIAEPDLPFLVRHLPFILTLLFIVALHQPLARGLAPQIEYVTALIGAEPAQAAPIYEQRPNSDGILIDGQPRNLSKPKLFSI